MNSGEVGKVCFRGPTVFAGDEGTPNNTVFFQDFFRTSDLGLLDQEGDLLMRGRLKEMINVSGEQVSPFEIETAVLEMPDVIEAAAYAVPHPTLGEQVGLCVAERGEVSQDAIKAFLADRLASFKRPNLVSFVDQLPRWANAKVDRVQLKRTAEAEWEARILKCRMPVGDDDLSTWVATACRQSSFSWLWKSA